MQLIDELLRSHDDLRGALIVAGKRIRFLNKGHKNDLILQLLRRQLRESRRIAKAYRAASGSG